MKAHRWHTLQLSAVLVILALLLGIGLHFTAPHSVAQASKQPDTIRIMPLGDSITYGNGSPTHSSYRLALWQRLTAAGIKFSFVGSMHSGSKLLPDQANEGHPGWRIHQLSVHIVDWLHTYRPNYVLLQVGTNDIVGNDDLPHAPARLKLLLDQITATQPGVTVLVAQITPLNSALETKVLAFNAAIPTLVSQEVAAGKRVQYVDLHDYVPMKDILDKIHPDDAGYTQMARVWYMALHPLLSVQALPGSLNIDDAPGNGIYNFHYVGHWSHCTDCGDELFDRSNSWDNTPNDYATLTFHGADLYLYAVKDTINGIAAVSIDGTEEVALDLYASNREGNQLVWLGPVLRNDYHTLKIRVTGTKDGASLNTFVVLDHATIVPAIV